MWYIDGISRHGQKTMNEDLKQKFASNEQSKKDFTKQVMDILKEARMIVGCLPTCPSESNEQFIECMARAQVTNSFLSDEKDTDRYGAILYGLSVIFQDIDTKRVTDLLNKIGSLESLSKFKELPLLKPIPEIKI